MLALSELASRLRHDLRGPLLNIRMGLQLVKEGQGGADLLEQLLGQVDRAERLVELLVDYAGAEDPRLVTVRLGPVLHQLSHEFAALELDVEPCQPVAIDVDQELRVYGLLLENARRAAGETGRVRVSLRAVGEEQEVRVEDSGPGIPEEDREKVLAPFYSTWGGAGLGLAVASRVAEARGGRLWIEDSTELGGACVVVRYR